MPTRSCNAQGQFGFLTSVEELRFDVSFEMETSDSTNIAIHSNAAQTILLVDDHPLFRAGIGALLRDESDFVVCGEAENASTALAAIRRLHPALAIVDLSMPGTDGIEFTKHILAEEPKLKVLILSCHDETLYALRALRAGARGYVMKSAQPHEVLMALRTVLGGALYLSDGLRQRLIVRAVDAWAGIGSSPVDSLSDRELEVIRLLGKGHTTKEIADSLHLSVKTIETHRMHIKEKLAFKDARELVRFAAEWIEEEAG